MSPVPREALRLSSGAASKCLEIRFYNRCFTSRAPVETSPSETVCRAPWETRRRSPSRSSSIVAFPRFAEEDAGPPCGHPASDSRALDGALPASGPSTATLVALSRRVGESAAALSAWQRLCRRRPSDTSLLGGFARGSPEQPSHTACARCHRVHVNATGFPEPEVPSTGGDPRERPCESSTGSAATLAGGAAAARLHRCSRTSTRPLDRSLS
jgi:hypothetical protein